MSNFIDALLNEVLTPGSVWKTVLILGGEPKEKFLVVVRVSATEVLCVMTTSQVWRFQSTTRIQKNVSYVLVRKGSYDCFPLETYIDCDQIYRRDLDAWTRFYRSTRLTYEGQLESELVEEIFQRLRESVQLSQAEKELAGVY